MLCLGDGACGRCSCSLGGCFTSWSCVTKCLGGDYLAVLHGRIHCRWLNRKRGWLLCNGVGMRLWLCCCDAENICIYGCAVDMSAVEIECVVDIYLAQLCDKCQVNIYLTSAFIMTCQHIDIKKWYQKSWPCGVYCSGHYDIHIERFYSFSFSIYHVSVSQAIRQKRQPTNHGTQGK